MIVKNERKRGRRSCWPDTFVHEVVEVICEKQHYRKKLIYTNNKASNNVDLYTEIVEAVKQRCKERGKLFNFSPVQTRTKFKACVAACKEAAMTRRYGSGLSNYLVEQPLGFKNCFHLLSQGIHVIQRWQLNHHLNYYHEEALLMIMKAINHQ